jgi:hypothetical protein
MVGWDLTAPGIGARAFFTNAKAVAFNGFAIKTLNGCTGFMAFHFDPAKAAAGASKNIPGDGMIEHATKLRKEFGKFLLVKVTGEISNVQSDHEDPHG